MNRDPKRRRRAHPQAEAILNRVARALAANRTPGFHFPGYFLELTWPRIEGHTVLEAMQSGPHCTNADGSINAAALGVTLDAALATAPRLVIEPGARQATVHLNVQYTGHPPRGAMEVEVALEGFFASDAVRQALVRGVMTSEGQTVCYASGTFAVVPPPPGVKLAPLPWQTEVKGAHPALAAHELTPKESLVMRAAEVALARSDARHGFIEHFWGLLPKTTERGAACRVKIGPQIGNRVGHVQGGILFGLAQATAAAAVPRHPALSNISAWYVSPGQGNTLSVRSRTLHAGRSFAVVRTEVKGADGRLVLEAVSNHAARHAPHGAAG
jgi:acyl-coenzyme A thioesterase PaaI-like protein